MVTTASEVTMASKLARIPKRDLRTVHSCRGFVRSCIDHRFWGAVAQYVQEHHFAPGDYDFNTSAGGVKSIIDEAAREHGVANMLISCRLHTVTTIVLVAHEDCGAYKNIVSFTSRENERVFHIEQLHAAREVIKEVLRVQGNGCYDDRPDPAAVIDFVFLYAHFSADGTEVCIEDVTNTS